MENITYYVAIVLTLVHAASGILFTFAAGYGLFRGTQAEKFPFARLALLARLLTGVADFLVGITLFWHVNESTTSTVSVLLSVSASGMLSWFTRTYMIEAIREEWIRREGGEQRAKH